jgi:hypothetical protein
MDVQEDGMTCSLYGERRNAYNILVIQVQQWIGRFGNTEYIQLLSSRENSTTTILQSLIYHSLWWGCGTVHIGYSL